jgi:hypothetical protein
MKFLTIAIALSMLATPARSQQMAPVLRSLPAEAQKWNGEVRASCQAQLELRPVLRGLRTWPTTRHGSSTTRMSHLRH